VIVWLASWPRSGNTFVRILLKTCLGLETYSIYNDPYFAEGDEQVKGWVGQIQYDGDQEEFLARCRTDPGLHIIKTHSAPIDSSPAIYVVRHGLAASVSYQRYAHSVEDFRVSLLDIVNGRGWAGAWGDHVRAWDPLNRPNTLLVRYEALVADPHAEALRLGEFLDRPVTRHDIPSFATLQATDPYFFRSGSANVDVPGIPKAVSDAFWQHDGVVAAALGYVLPADEAAKLVASDAASLLNDSGSCNEKVDVSAPVSGETNSEDVTQELPMAQESLMPAIRSADQAANMLEQIGKSLLQLGSIDAAQHAFEAAAEIDLADRELQKSFGGPLNGQAGRQKLFLDMLRALAPVAIIETGTFRGTSTDWMASAFAGPIMTCEIEPRLATQARRKLAKHRHVTVFNDDSRAFLTAVLPTLPTNRPVLYYLDAHWQDDLPLVEEVRSILGYSLYSIIMIDDFRVPWDDGYGFDYYGPDKMLDLSLLSFLAGSPARIFFPTLPSDQETGGKRGACVIAAAPPVLDVLRRVPGLRESDWTGERYREAPSATAGTTPANIALGCRASQSSTSIWSRPDDAQGGINGVINGSFGFHTDFEPCPWWMVDLGAAAQFDEIVIYNRMDSCRERANTLWVLISSDGESWKRIHMQGNAPFGGIDGNPLRVHCPGSRARYVKLQLDSTDYLHLDQVQVLRYAAADAEHDQAPAGNALTETSRDDLQPSLA